MTELLSHALRALTLWTGSGVADCADTSPDMWIRWSDLKPLILRIETLEAENADLKQLANARKEEIERRSRQSAHLEYEIEKLGQTISTLTRQLHGRED
jgi:hypothetical protein